jgi:hypothetical protein
MMITSMVEPMALVKCNQIDSTCGHAFDLLIGHLKY